MSLAVFWRSGQLIALGSFGRADPLCRAVQPNSSIWKLDFQRVSQGFSPSLSAAFSTRGTEFSTLAYHASAREAMGKHKKGGKKKSHPDDEYIVPDDEYIVEGVRECSVSTAGVDNDSSAAPVSGKTTIDVGRVHDGGSASSSPRAGRGTRKLAFARVVAAFYPKFENESADMEVREEEEP